MTISHSCRAGATHHRRGHVGGWVAPPSKERYGFEHVGGIAGHGSSPNSDDDDAARARCGAAGPAPGIHPDRAAGGDHDHRHHPRVPARRGQRRRRRAEQDATLALITKLEGGINDRLDALLQTRPDPNLGALYLAAYLLRRITQPHESSLQRAQVFAWYDYIKSELPDVFFVQNYDRVPIPSTSRPTPIRDAELTAWAWAITCCRSATGSRGHCRAWRWEHCPPGDGHLRRSYFAAAGVYKNLGYLPTGYDGIDNDGNGLDRRLDGGRRTLRANAKPHVVATVQATSPPTSTTPRAQRRSMPSWSEAWGPWARSSAPTTSATGR